MYFFTKVRNNFWAKVNKTDTCWLWTGASSGRYGHLKFNRENMYAHRLSWMFVNGEIPEGLQILHSCDVDKCVNPEHLFLGTQKDNIQDMMRKGRDNFRGRKRASF